MVQKRPLDDGEIIEISSKQPRQLEQSKNLIPFSEHVSPEDLLQNHHTLEGRLAKNGTGSSWVSDSTGGEQSCSEVSLHFSLFPDFFKPEHQIRVTRREEIYSLLLDLPPQKYVAIGPEYQADIPPFDPKIKLNHLNTSGSASGSTLIVEDTSVDKWMGTCVIPMPDLEISVGDEDKVGKGRTNCRCEDLGSVRCVRQHITEEREKLYKSFGPEKFKELGFSDMGEQVAQKWSEEEEQLFHEVVLSNPASLGKNFWDNLSSVFPSRTKMQIVSYYFNVFMFWRRAEQNRTYSLDIDSDNDDWPESGECGDHEFGVSEEDEDSVVESPIYHGGSDYDHDLQESDEDVADDMLNNNENGTVGDAINEISDRYPRNCLDNCVPGEVIWNEKEGDGEAHDDSCTSSDTGTASQGTKGNIEPGEQWLTTSFNGSGNEVGHDYIMEPCDAKVWSTGYLNCFKNEADFLPTCSMIEEVFGDGSCDYKPRDGKNLS